MVWKYSCQTRGIWGDHYCRPRLMLSKIMCSSEINWSAKWTSNAQFSAQQIGLMNSGLVPECWCLEGPGSMGCCILCDCQNGEEEAARLQVEDKLGFVKTLRVPVSSSDHWKHGCFFYLASTCKYISTIHWVPWLSLSISSFQIIPVTVSRICSSVRHRSGSSTIKHRLKLFGSQEMTGKERNWNTHEYHALASSYRYILWIFIFQYTMIHIRHRYLAYIYIYVSYKLHWSICGFRQIFFTELCCIRWILCKEPCAQGFFFSKFKGDRHHWCSKGLTEMYTTILSGST